MPIFSKAAALQDI